MSEVLHGEAPLRKADSAGGRSVSLRFASDEELPALVKKALDENADQETIKQAIQNWRPDFQRV